MKKKFKEALDQAAHELANLSPEEFAKRLEESKNSDMLPFIQEHVAATAMPWSELERARAKIETVKRFLKEQCCCTRDLNAAGILCSYCDQRKLLEEE